MGDELTMLAIPWRGHTGCRWAVKVGFNGEEQGELQVPHRRIDIACVSHVSHTIWPVLRVISTHVDLDDCHICPNSNSLPEQLKTIKQTGLRNPYNY